METVTVEIPESMRDSIQGRVAEGGFASISEYVSDLIRADLEQKDQERLEDMLEEGLDSGESIVVDDAFWEAHRQRLIAKYGSAAEGQ